MPRTLFFTGNIVTKKVPARREKKVHGKRVRNCFPLTIIKFLHVLIHNKALGNLPPSKGLKQQGEIYTGGE